MVCTLTYTAHVKQSYPHGFVYQLYRNLVLSAGTGLMVTVLDVVLTAGTDIHCPFDSTSNPRCDRSGATPLPACSIVMTRPCPSFVRVTRPAKGPTVSTGTL